MLIAGAALLLTQVSAWAQDGMDGYTAPTLEGAFPWRAIGATAICFAGVLIAGLMNSRRTQQKSR